MRVILLQLNKVVNQIEKADVHLSMLRKLSELVMLQTLSP